MPRPDRATCCGDGRCVVADVSERYLSKEIAAAKALRESIAAVIGDDEETVRDTIEGETGLHEAIASVMEAIREDQIMIEGLKAMISSLDERQSRLESRVARCRAAIEQAMQIGEIKTLPLPDATLTLKAVAPKLEILDEAKIPAQFWKPSDPKLDRKAVADALKAGAEVPGAMFGNGSITLQIRRQ